MADVPKLSDFKPEAKREIAKICMRGLQRREEALKQQRQANYKG